MKANANAVLEQKLKEAEDARKKAEDDAKAAEDARKKAEEVATPLAPFALVIFILAILFVKMKI